jgi:transposase-like protein
VTEPTPQRQRWKPTDEERRIVQMMAFNGDTSANIARKMRVTEQTLLRHCARELENGRKQAADMITDAQTRLEALAAGTNLDLRRRGHRRVQRAAERFLKKKRKNRG